MSTNTPQLIEWSKELPWRLREPINVSFPCWTWHMHSKMWVAAYGAWHVGLGCESHWIPLGEGLPTVTPPQAEIDTAWKDALVQLGLKKPNTQNPLPQATD